MNVLKRGSNRINGWVMIFVFLSILLGTALPAKATSFNLMFDSSTSAAPAAFFSAFGNAIQTYQTFFSDPIVVNVRVGWGEINGNPLNPGNLGQSLTNQQAVSYDTLRSALISDRK